MTTGYITVTLSFAREGEQWLGECLELGTSTFSESLEQCQEELQELVGEHLAVLEDVGERERFFQDWGIAVHPTREVPRQLTIRGSGDSWNKLFEDTIDPNGPFLRPRVFSIDVKGKEDLRPVNL